jgi:hypothetical protein
MAVAVVVDRNQPKMEQAEAQAAVAPVTPLTHRLGWGAQALQDKVTTVLTVMLPEDKAVVVVAQGLLVLYTAAALDYRLQSQEHQLHALAVAVAILPVQGDQAAAALVA